MVSAPSASPSIELGEEAGLVLSSQHGDVACYRDLARQHGFALYRAAFELTLD